MEALIAPFLAAGPAAALAAAGVFARVGAAVFLVPGIGERAIPVRVKLAAALALTALLAPIIAPMAAEVRPAPAAIAALLIGEAAAGLVIGLAFRLLIFALQIAGMAAAQSVSISHMFGTGVAAEAEPTIATFLAMGGVVLAMAAGLHVHLVAALAGLYAVLPFGALLPGSEAADWSTRRLAGTFALGLSLALPFVAAGFVYNLALGALSRAMPQLLVALVGVPLLVGLGLGLLWLALPEIYARWGEALGLVFADPLGGLR